ncbi:MAG TPA: hypothetical protein VK425_04635, partial [Acidimicrobiales bacterium]|nr:hypothetical protein [Acidimicrobiales bacterium]
YADVTSNSYSIGAPSGGVTSVTASPSSATAGAPTSFQVGFTASVALSGASGDWVSIVPSTALGSVPNSIALVAGSCIQGGTNRGSASPSGVTIDLESSCDVSTGTRVEVDLDANAPSAPGSLYFTVTSKENATASTSSTITVKASGPSLWAASYSFGANTTYTLSNYVVANLGSGGATLSITAAATQGSETVSFYNGVPGYTVTYTPSGGSATSDPVQGVVAVGASATLTLATALADGGTVVVTATGTNPAPTPTTTEDDFHIQAGNATAGTTNSVLFGNSVSDVTVAASTTVASATATYTVGFTVADALAANQAISFGEAAGPTNFTAVTAVEVKDTTQDWTAVSTPVGGDGVITFAPIRAVNAGDQLTVFVPEVTNPPGSGSIADFSVATQTDPVPAYAAPYTIGANVAPGVVVTASPTTTGAVSVYKISNVYASAAMTGGTSTVKVEAPAGTVFPNNPSLYALQDSTTASGSGPVTAALTGGGTNTVTFTVPNNISSGDMLTITVQDVLNPATASSSDSITLVGTVTGPAPEAATTTTTRPKPPAKPKPSVTLLTSSVEVLMTKVETASLRLHCASSTCAGEINLVEGKATGLIKTMEKYTLGAGRTASFSLTLDRTCALLLGRAKKHTLLAEATVTVTGGKTVSGKVTLVGEALLKTKPGK